MVSNKRAHISAPINRATKAVAIWLLACCAAVFVMVVIGGITRLTESGLSMVEWRPLIGWLPPLNDAEWQRVFSLYQQTPEFQKINAGMGLAEFKTIFWWEFIHRLWGRAIGVIFLLPLLVFILRGAVRGLTLRLAAIFALGGLQGGMGWYMVKSGLVDDPYVSQYRLTAHLALAFLIYAWMLWTALDLLNPISKRPNYHRPTGGVRFLACLVGCLVTVTVVSGGFVAGLDAGLIFNTFPTMDGVWIPDEYWFLEPARYNFVENPVAVQFNHRVLAMTTLLSVFALGIAVHGTQLTIRSRYAVNLLLVMVVVQAGLGIGTLLLAVPVSLGALHQGGALVLFTVMLWTLHELRPAHSIVTPADLVMRDAARPHPSLPMVPRATATQPTTTANGPHKPGPGIP